MFAHLFTPARFQGHLTTATIGRFLMYRPVTDSTMVIAAREAREGAPAGTLVLAESQTAGRGRKGRTFHSDERGGLYFTLILRLPNEQHARLPVVAPLAVVRACEAQGIDARIKWPNDVWVAERKLCGMLVDAQFDNGQPVALVGIGINVNNNPAAIPELRDIATSMQVELGRAVEREPLLAGICNAFEELLALPAASLSAAYRSRNLVVGSNVRVTLHDGATFDAMAVNLTASGELIVRHENGREEVLSAAEVSVRPRS